MSITGGITGSNNSSTLRLDIKGSSVVATTANISLTGEQTIDGVLTSSSRVVVKEQTTGAENGIYITSAGAWTRASDMPLGSTVAGSQVYVEQGTVNGDTIFGVTNDGGSDVVGTDAIVFTRFSSTASVVGPGSSTDNAVARWDGTSGLVVQNSVVTISDTGAVTGVLSLTSTVAGDFSNTAGIAGTELFGSGAGANLTSGVNTLIGYQAGNLITTGTGNTILGYDADVNANSDNYATAIGATAVARTGCTVIGYGAVTTGNNQFVAGSTTAPIASVYFGNGVQAASPQNCAIYGTLGFGTDINGGNLSLVGGSGTGTGTPGSVIFRTGTPTGVSGSTQQTVTTRLAVFGDGGVEWFGIATASAPAVSTAGRGRIFFDSTLNKFQVSQNNGAYVDLYSVVSDTTPQLGGPLDCQQQSVYFTDNVLTPAGTTATANLTAGNHWTLDCGSASGTVVLTITVPTARQSGQIIVKQGATARDITWTPSAGSVKWQGTEPTWSSDTSKYRIVSYVWNSTDSILHLAATETD